MPVFKSLKVRENIRKALKEGKLVVIAQRETTRVVKPENPDRIVFIAGEEL